MTTGLISECEGFEMARKATTASSTSRSADHHLPSAERDVLSCLWQEEQATARRIREMMKRYRPMAHGSVVTLLVRLEEKGLISKEKGPVGKAFIFKPTKRPEPTYRSLVKELLTRVFGGDALKMAATLFEVQSLSPAELEQLKGLVKGLKGKPKKKAKRH